VLAYHAVTPSWRHALAVHPDRFREQLAALAGRGFRGVTFAEAAGGDLHSPSVCITFDDAFGSTFTWGAPLLDELGWPATVFPVTNPTSAGKPMRWLERNTAVAFDGDLTPMSWDQLEQLGAAGWEIGSHTRTHRRLSQLGPDELDDELGGSREEIAGRLGACSSVSYPWGEVHPRVVAAARRAGYTAASGLDGRFRRGDPMAVPRFAVSGADGPVRYRLKTSRWFWALRSTPAWIWLDSVRHRQVPQ
jgi:peptidoglycan/xylan/chitin deacetylase (PgdA/CDA1 family)